MPFLWAARGHRHGGIHRHSVQPGSALPPIQSHARSGSPGTSPILEFQGAFMKCCGYGAAWDRVSLGRRESGGCDHTSRGRLGLGLLAVPQSAVSDPHSASQVSHFFRLLWLRDVSQAGCGSERCRKHHSPPHGPVWSCGSNPAHHCRGLLLGPWPVVCGFVQGTAYPRGHLKGLASAAP